MSSGQAVNPVGLLWGSGFGGEVINLEGSAASGAGSEAEIEYQVALDVVGNKTGVGRARSGGVYRDSEAPCGQVYVGDIRAGGR
jgi:hypothetical protein